MGAAQPPSLLLAASAALSPKLGESIRVLGAARPSEFALRLLSALNRPFGPFRLWSKACWHVHQLNFAMNRSAKLFYYCVEWDDATCSWDIFRSSVIGPTDPVDAPPDSLRGLIAARWEELGLSGPCDVGDNAVHGSASPFEAMIERCNWLTSASQVLL